MDLRTLSKKDLISLIELSYKSIECYDENHFKSLFLELQNLIDFEYAGSGYSNINEVFSDNGFKSGAFNINYPEEFLEIYLSQKYHLKDPVLRNFYTTLDIQNFHETTKKYSLGWGNLLKLTNDFGINDGFIYGTYDHVKISGTYFYFSGSKVENNERTRVIIKYVVPFLSTALKRLIIHKKKPLIFSLTNKEIDVLKWLKEGKTSWEISIILTVSESTINFHIKNIMKKLDSVNRTHAIAIAFENGLFDL